MLIKISPIIPQINGITTTPFITVICIVLFLAVVIMVSISLAKYAAKRFNGNKRRATTVFIILSVAIAVFLYGFFGFSARAVRGIVFCHILLLSSYSDLKTRECDDWLSVMILLAGLINLEITEIPSRIFAGLFVGGIMLLSVLIGKNKQIGGADIKIAACSTFLLGLERGVIGLIVGLFIAIISNIIKRNKKGFPLLPYLSVAFMTAYFL